MLVRRLYDCHNFYYYNIIVSFVALWSCFGLALFLLVVCILVKVGTPSNIPRSNNTSKADDHILTCVCTCEDKFLMRKKAIGSSLSQWENANKQSNSLETTQASPKCPYTPPPSFESDKLQSIYTSKGKHVEEDNIMHAKKNTKRQIVHFVEDWIMSGWTYTPTLQ